MWISKLEYESLVEAAKYKPKIIKYKCPECDAENLYSFPKYPRTPIIKARCCECNKMYGIARTDEETIGIIKMVEYK